MIFYSGIFKIKQMNIIKQKQIRRYTEQTNGYQLGEGKREEQEWYGINRYKLACIK